MSEYRHFIGLGLLILLVVVYFYLNGKKGKDDPIKLKMERPDWISGTRLHGALISPTRTIYSTHMQTGNVGHIHYNGVDYKVHKKIVIDDPRAQAYGGNTTETLSTDITILVHDPVPITPVKIANVEPKENERLICYFSDRVVSAIVAKTCRVKTSLFYLYFHFILILFYHRFSSSLLPSFPFFLLFFHSSCFFPILC